MLTKTNIRLLNKSIGVTGFIISSFLILNFPDILIFITNIIERNFSPDNQLNSTSKSEIKAYVAFGISVMLFISIYFLFNLHIKFVNFLKSTISQNEVSNFFLSDQLCNRNTHTSFILWAGPLIGLLSYFFYLVSGKEENEGIIEKISSLLFLFSGILLLISISKIKNLSLSSKIRNKVLVITTIISFFILIIFGEEISWGQQLFHWKSAEIFNKYNFQNETNIHNFFNPLYKFVYPIAGMSAFVFLFFLWFFPQKNSNYLHKLFIPHQSLFFLVVLFTCTTFLKYREISEQILADFSLLYSLRIYMCLKFPSNNLSE